MLSKDIFIQLIKLYINDLKRIFKEAPKVKKKNASISWSEQ